MEKPCHHCGMGFFRGPFLYVPLLVLLLAFIGLRIALSARDAVYFGSSIVVLAAAGGYEVLRRRRIDRGNRPDSEPED
jgi:nitrate reductase gamma subunit